MQLHVFTRYFFNLLFLCGIDGTYPWDPATNTKFLRFIFEKFVECSDLIKAVFSTKSSNKSKLQIKAQEGNSHLSCICAKNCFNQIKTNNKFLEKNPDL